MKIVYVKTTGGFIAMEHDEWVKAAVRHTRAKRRTTWKSTQPLSKIDAISEGPVEVRWMDCALLNSTPSGEGNTTHPARWWFRPVSRSSHRRRDLNSPAPETVLGTEV